MQLIEMNIDHGTGKVQTYMHTCIFDSGRLEIQISCPSAEDVVPVDLLL